MGFHTRKLLVVCLTLVGLAALVAPGAIAADEGQIKGTITDQATGEPIIGASVQIVGTSMGAQTDLDGHYQILRVEPGTYELRVSSVGYKTVTITDVEVKPNLTNEQNLEIESSVSELEEEITVVGQRDIIDKFEVSSQVNLGKEAIEAKPVTNVDQLIQQVAGVQTTSEGEVFVRGGRAGEVSYIVDGVPIGDPLGGLGQTGANLSLVSGSISQIQIIKDGFDPEYGNALSGIVNIRSQTGSKDNTRMNLQYITDDLGNSELNDFSRNFDFVRFSLSGPDPIFKNRILPALGLNFLEDKEFTYFLYAEVEKSDDIWQYSEFDSPTTERPWQQYNLFGFDIPDRQVNKYNIMANLKFRPQQNLKFVLSMKKWVRDQTIFDWDYRYSSLTAPVTRLEQSSVSLEITQNIDQDMFYEAIFSATDFDFKWQPGDPNNPGRGLEPDDFLLQSEWETWTDLNGNGVYDPPEPIVNVFPDTASYGTNFSGPGYTGTEFDAQFLQNTQGGGFIPTNFRFNDNGVIDPFEGEAFIDLNGNGVWDAGEFLQDKNGNGQLDDHRLSPINQRNPEPYIDGDSVLGEPFVDLNSNGVYEIGIDAFIIDRDPAINQDLNRNGKYDGPNDPWEPGVPFLDRNGNGLFDPPNNQYDPGEKFSDVNGNGEYDFGGNSTFLDPGSFTTGAVWSQRTVRTYRGEVKMIRQMGNHELKGGFAITRDRLTFEEIERPYLPYTGRPDGGAFPDRGAFRDFYKYTPWSGTAYFRDKLEYGSMIASLGLRWDFFLQDTDELAQTLRNDDRGGVIEGDRHKFSPRIGFSYPISDKAKVYFNYGHFFQLPQFQFMYQRNTASVDQNDVQGNPNLDYQKTIQYSFGVKYKMSESYSVDIQGYFKDEFDKINPTEILDGFITRQAYLNSDYGRGRGIEVTLEKRGGGYVSGQVSYTYAFSFGKASETTQDFQDENQLLRTPLSEHPLNNDIRHSLKSAITFYMPSTVKPRLFGIPIPNGWSLSIESIIESGAPFTPSANYPGITAIGTQDIEENSLRLPSTAVFDIRFAKEFKAVGLDLQGILWVENVFDSRNVLSVYSSTGRADTDQNVNGVVFGGTDFSANPRLVDYGRQIRVGLEMNL